MFKTLIKLALFLIVGILVYNYFLGTPDEKERSEKIFQDVRDVAVNVADLVRSEKEKFDAGKYDNVVDEVEDLLDKLKRNAKEFDENYLDRIEGLEKKRRELEDAISTYNKEEKRDEKITVDTSAIKRELQELLRQTEDLVGEMKSN